jgi:hygromycin-B 4-O-kinase
MGHALGEDLDPSQVQVFLASQFDPASHEVEHLGAGAWSRCFGFRRGEQELVVRFGQHLDDFRKDHLAAAFSAPELPIPAVLAIGEAFDGFYAVSTRIRGIPLESVSEAQWHSLVPALADALEAMRLAEVSATAGFGGWDEAGRAPHARWSEYLLSVSNDTPQQRMYG